MTREDDIQALCKQVLKTEVLQQPYYDSYEYFCPFCGKQDYSHSDGLASMEHEGTCAYLIAKDLITI